MRMTTFPRTRNRARRASDTPRRTRWPGRDSPRGGNRTGARLRSLVRAVICIVRLLGTVGTVARGVVVALVGILVINAAVSHNPATSGGIGKAPLSLRNQSAGPVPLVLVALGLVIFGIYGLCEARWRRV